MTIRQFLRTLLNEDTPEGDFARDFKSDHKTAEHFKGKPVTFTGLKKHLYNQGACLEAFQALEEVRQRYEELLKMGTGGNEHTTAPRPSKSRSACGQPPRSYRRRR